MKSFRIKLFNSDSRLHKFLNILLLPFMAVASCIALVIYLSAMFVTILVIQSVGFLLGIYSFLKWVHHATLRVFNHAPLPMRR